MTQSVKQNINLNVNPARADRFFLTFGDIPSLPLLTPQDLTQFQAEQLQIDEKSFFHLAVRSVELPGLSLGDAKIDTMFNSIAETNLKFTYDNLVTELRVDNNFLVYKMLVLWMMLINSPDGFNQFANRKTFDRTAITAILTVKDNFQNSIISFEFYDLRPISISSIPLSFTNEGDEIMLTVNWQYTYFMPKTATGQPYDLTLSS